MEIRTVFCPFFYKASYNYGYLALCWCFDRSNHCHCHWCTCVLSRSRDRPVLVRGTWGATHRALWEEAQQRGVSGQRGNAAYGQDVGAAAQQHQKQGESWEHGCGGQGLVTVMAHILPLIHERLHFLSWLRLRTLLLSTVFLSVKRPWLTHEITLQMYLYIKICILYWLINQDVMIRLSLLYLRAYSKYCLSSEKVFQFANFIHFIIHFHFSEYCGT